MAISPSQPSAIARGTYFFLDLAHKEAVKTFNPRSLATAGALAATYKLATYLFEKWRESTHAPTTDLNLFDTLPNDVLSLLCSDHLSIKEIGRLQQVNRKASRHFSFFPSTFTNAHDKVLAQKERLAQIEFNASLPTLKTILPITLVSYSFFHAALAFFQQAPEFTPTIYNIQRKLSPVDYLLPFFTAYAWIREAPDPPLFKYIITSFALLILAIPGLLMSQFCRWIVTLPLKCAHLYPQVHLSPTLILNWGFTSRTMSIGAWIRAFTSFLCMFGFISSNPFAIPLATILALVAGAGYAAPQFHMFLRIPFQNDILIHPSRLENPETLLPYLASLLHTTLTPAAAPPAPMPLLTPTASIPSPLSSVFFTPAP